MEVYMGKATRRYKKRRTGRRRKSIRRNTRRRRYSKRRRTGGNGRIGDWLLKNDDSCDKWTRVGDSRHVNYGDGKKVLDCNILQRQGQNVFCRNPSQGDRCRDDAFRWSSKEISDPLTNKSARDRQIEYQDKLLNSNITNLTKYERVQNIQRGEAG